MSDSTKQHKATAPKKLKFALYVCSTSRYEQLKRGNYVKDVSGDIIESLVTNAGHTIVERQIISDNNKMIEEKLQKALASEVDAVIFSGGTGIAPSDITIETVSPFMEKTLPGFGEIFRLLSYEKIGSAAIMSRAFAGVANGKVFFCIPGSPDAVKVCIERLILPEATHIIKHSRE